MVSEHEVTRLATEARPHPRSMDPVKMAELAVVLASIALLLAATALVLALARLVGQSDPWSAVSALASLSAVAVAIGAYGQWKRQLRLQNRQKAAADVLGKAYEYQELFREIDRHARMIRLNTTYRRQFVESNDVLAQHREIMMGYTRQVEEVSSQLEAALFKASVVSGYELPIDPNVLVPLEAGVVWSWLTMAFIKAAALPEGSPDRKALLEEKFRKVEEMSEQAPEAMRLARNELRRVLAPLFVA